jgi:hypothetical protein
MGIDMPTALVILGILGTMSTAIIKFVPRREMANGNGKYVSREVCDKVHEGLNAWGRRVEADIGEIKADVKHLLEHPRR